MMDKDGYGRLGPTQRLGWHLMPLDRRLRYSDGRKVWRGRKLAMKNLRAGAVICKRGMHAAPRIQQVMWAAGTFGYIGNFEGGYLSLVLVDGYDPAQNRLDKFVGTHRTVLWTAKYTGPKGAGATGLIDWALEAGCPRRLLKKVGAL